MNYIYIIIIINVYYYHHQCLKLYICFNITEKENGLIPSTFRYDIKQSLQKKRAKKTGHYISMTEPEVDLFVAPGPCASPASS